MDLESITQPPLRDNIAGIVRFLFDLLSQVVDVDFMIVGPICILPAPYLGQQSVVGQFPSDVVQKAVEESVLDGRELDPLATVSTALSLLAA